MYIDNHTRNYYIFAPNVKYNLEYTREEGKSIACTHNFTLFIVLSSFLMFQNFFYCCLFLFREPPLAALLG